jgi:23S rRNA (cytidine1920-2'-O)/16S rRNA (cytidine1409-2'-O)-methyltransferase
MGKQRLDQLLVDRGLAADLEQAARACIAGDVYTDNRRLTKPGERLNDDIVLQVHGSQRFVSRGGEKLDGALEQFGLDVSGWRCLDIGASSGGFTDCLLQRGAASVLAVDVGYGQLDWKLRNDPRVQVLERTNIRELDPAAVGAPFDLAVCDLSFASLSNMLPVIEGFLCTGAQAGCAGSHLVALIKPQFELNSEKVETGIIRDWNLHQEALEKVLAALPVGVLTPCGLGFSAIKGAKGNIEFFLWAQCYGIPANIDVKEVVESAHARLDW